MTGFTVEEKEAIDLKYAQLRESYLDSNPNGNIDIIDKAFVFANEAHKNMRRKSGEPYIFHPLEVAQIVSSEIGLGATSITCALLHDVVEDTDYTVDDIAGMFNDRIAGIVDGLTKLKGVATNTSTVSMQAENFKKLLLTMSEDIRVILIKIADRLHNMRTLDVMAARKKYKISSETLYIYAPLAHRLGLYNIKSELEDLAFCYEHPTVFQALDEKLAATKVEFNQFFKEFSQPIIEKLNILDCQFEIKERVKSIFSIWKKMQVKNIPFEEVFDIFAIRIVFEPKNFLNEKTQCWNIYSAVTDIYLPKPDRIRDWLSSPKANGYEALHGTVMGPKGKWVEIQIRSRRMDEIAEKGYAAHWKYKGGVETSENALEQWLKTIREVLQSPDTDAIQFLDDFKANLFSNEIMVFTPKGEMKTLPQGSTVLDFAFAIHTDLGLHCLAAKVNHRAIPLSYKLQSGDQIEIITSSKVKPTEEWLDFVTTGHSKSKLKSIFKEDRRKAMKKGELALESALNNLKLTTNARIVKKMLTYFNLSKREELVYKIGKEKILLDDIATILKEKSENKIIKYWKLQFLRQKNNIEASLSPSKSSESLILTEENLGQKYKVADCCNPIPGDDIVCFIEDDNSILLHKRSCDIAIKLMSNFGNKIVEAEWSTHKLKSFLAVIKLNGFDRVGIVSEITRLISEYYAVNMRAINFESHDGIFEGIINLYVPHVEDLNNVISKLVNVKGVNSVRRVEAKDYISKVN